MGAHSPKLLQGQRSQGGKYERGHGGQRAALQQEISSLCCRLI